MEVFFTKAGMIVFVTTPHKVSGGPFFEVNSGVFISDLIE